MANREQRGNREKRKPKADKTKAVPQAASFGQPKLDVNKGKGGKKGS